MLGLVLLPAIALFGLAGFLTVATTTPIPKTPIPM